MVDIEGFVNNMIITCKINCYSDMVRELNNLTNQRLVKEYYI